MVFSQESPNQPVLYSCYEIATTVRIFKIMSPSIPSACISGIIIRTSAESTWYIMAMLFTSEQYSHYKSTTDIFLVEFLTFNDEGIKRTVIIEKSITFWSHSKRELYRMKQNFRLLCKSSETFRLTTQTYTELRKVRESKGQIFRGLHGIDWDFIVQLWGWFIKNSRITLN